jgi:hypothetical protein
MTEDQHTTITVYFWRTVIDHATGLLVRHEHWSEARACARLNMPVTEQLTAGVDTTLVLVYGSDHDAVAKRFGRKVGRLQAELTQHPACGYDGQQQGSMAPRHHTRRTARQAVTAFLDHEATEHLSEGEDFPERKPCPTGRCPQPP